MVCLQVSCQKQIGLLKTRLTEKQPMQHHKFTSAQAVLTLSSTGSDALGAIYNKRGNVHGIRTYKTNNDQPISQPNGITADNAGFIPFDLPDNTNSQIHIHRSLQSFIRIRKSRKTFLEVFV
jgi:hypothetical protein